MRCQKIAMPFVSVFISIFFCAFSFKQEGLEQYYVDVWYEYTGENTQVARANENNYFRYIVQPVNISIMCPGVSVLCAVKLPNTGVTPSPFTLAFKNQIESAINSQVDLSNVELRMN